jgi:hypothetical protein
MSIRVGQKAYGPQKQHDHPDDGHEQQRCGRDDAQSAANWRRLFFFTCPSKMGEKAGQRRQERCNLVEFMEIRPKRRNPRDAARKEQRERKGKPSRETEENLQKVHLCGEIGPLREKTGGCDEKV